jgi:mono/diheme cytochrome c family protein
MYGKQTSLKGSRFKTDGSLVRLPYIDLQPDLIHHHPELENCSAALPKLSNFPQQRLPTNPEVLYFRRERRLLNKSPRAESTLGFPIRGGVVMKFAKLLLIAAFAVGLYAGAEVFAQKEDPQVTRGKKLFMNYCASCHGTDGKGGGAVAPSLKKHPPDLTKLQKGAKFPTDEVRKKITGDLSSPVHGRKDMPVWGMIFSQSDITNLVKYLESIQRPFDPQPAG